jgi:hypothetical protein
VAKNEWRNTSTPPSDFKRAQHTLPLSRNSNANSGEGQNHDSPVHWLQQRLLRGTLFTDIALSEIFTTQYSEAELQRVHTVAQYSEEELQRVHTVAQYSEVELQRVHTVAQYSEVELQRVHSVAQYNEADLQRVNSVAQHNEAELQMCAPWHSTQTLTKAFFTAKNHTDSRHKPKCHFIYGPPHAHSHNTHNLPTFLWTFPSP